MIKTAVAASLLLAGAPALAQSTQPATAAQPAQPATPATPASPAQPAPSTTTTTQDPMTAPTGTTDGTTTTSTTTTTTATASTSSDTVMATVEADWATYDKNSNGSLSRAELETWLTALETAAGRKPQGKSYMAAAFTKADADKSKSVSKEELATFLKG
jgi:hypothetical protein